ncbi:hypothetical protein V3C99_004780 [Haemonchus contortus]
MLPSCKCGGFVTVKDGFPSVYIDAVQERPRYLIIRFVGKDIDYSSKTFNICISLRSW